MRDALVGLLEKADLAVASCVGVIDQDDLVMMATTIREARVRLSFPENMIVVALAGGTGSGKSSLANAICGADIAMVSGVRPTTEEPLAYVSEDRADEVVGYLETLGISQKNTDQLPHWLCLIDLPDTDSVKIDHRLQVEALIPRLDLVVWVVDPEKYRDAALHNRYLRHLVGYATQFIFVLNQVDRISPTEVDSVVVDFRRALEDDGIEAPTILTTVANPASGPPMGIAELADALEKATSSGSVSEKLLIDLEQAAVRLLGFTGGTGLDFERRAEAVTQASARLVVDGDTRGAIERLSEFLEAISTEAGGMTRSTIEEIAAAVPNYVESAADEARKLGPLTAETSRNSETVRSEQRAVASVALDVQTIAPTRKTLSLRARANADLIDLALSVTAVRSTAR
jgi:GTP-binding protein EngB required for normal cell division